MLAQRGLTLDDLGEILKIIYGGICALMTRTALRKKDRLTLSRCHRFCLTLVASALHFNLNLQILGAYFLLGG